MLGDPSLFLKDPITYAFSERPDGVVFGDFDGDRVLDASVSLPSGRMGFVLGIGRPGAKVSYSAYGLSGGGIRPIVSDFTGDGILDLVLNVTDVTLVTGLGSLQFSVGVPLMGIASDTSNSGLALDVDHDGRPDLVIPTLDGVMVLRNLGNGQFDAPGEVRGLAVGDFNGDGRADLLDWKGTREEDGVVARLAGPKGVFQPRTPTYPPYGSTSFRVIDLDRDGKLDVVGFELRNGGSLSNRVFIGLGKGDGTFNFLTPLNIGRSITSGGLADFDGDGRLDLVVGNGTAAPGHPSVVTIAFGHGDGTFGTPIDIDLGAESGIVAPGDFDGDGRPDLLIYRDNATGVIALNDGTGHFRTPISVGNIPPDFAVADLDNDGKGDFVTANRQVSPGFLQAFFSAGDGTFVSSDRYSLGSTSLSGVSIQFPDLNGDGRRDIAVGIYEQYEGAHLIPMLSQGTRRFVQSPSVRTTSYAFGFGDFDGNGSIDLLDGYYPRLSRCAGATFRRRAVGH